MEGQDGSSAKLVVVVDDDPLVLEATEGLLTSWGCQAVTADSYAVALQKLADLGRRPDLIICDYRLSEERSGIDVIRNLRSLFEIPALLISGDPIHSGGQETADNRYTLLQKPLNAASFRAALVGASVLRT